MILFLRYLSHSVGEIQAVQIGAERKLLLYRVIMKHPPVQTPERLLCSATGHRLDPFTRHAILSG